MEVGRLQVQTRRVVGPAPTDTGIYLGFSFVQLLHYWDLIGREFQSVEIFSNHSDATPALLCHKEPAQGMQSPRLLLLA